MNKQIIEKVRMKLKEAVIKQILYFITGYMFSKISPKPPHSQGRWGGGNHTILTN